MSTVRFSIGGLMGVVLVAAIGLAALRNASEPWAGVMLLLTHGVLGFAAIGVVCRRHVERAWWLGFSLFGWGYLALVAFWPWYDFPPTTTLLEVVGPRLGVPPHYGWGMGGVRLNPSYAQVGHCLWALLAAILGG